MPYLSVIIPAYNEEKRISKTLLSVDQYLTKQSFDYEILVVNGGSTDKTAEVVTNFQKMIKNLRLLTKDGCRGKGEAVRFGMAHTQGQIRLFMDADNSTTLDHFGRMKPYFDKGYDIVIGTRDKKDLAEAQQAVPQPWIKRQLGNVGNLLIQIFAVPGIWDTQCGFKAFTAEVADTVFPKGKIDRWGFDFEILAIARKLGFKIAKIPVYWINDAESKVSFSGYINTFKELFQVWWWLIIDKYGIKK